MNFIDISGDWSDHRDGLLVTTSEGDLSSSDCRVGINPLVFFHIDANHDSCVLQSIVAYSAITVCVPTVMVRVEVAVGTVARVEAICCFPAVGHAVQIGVESPWRCEIGWSEDVGHLVLFVVVHAIFVPIAVAIRSV